MKFEHIHGPFGVPVSTTRVLQMELNRADELEALDDASKFSRKVEVLSDLVCKLAELLPDAQQVILVKHVSDAWRELPVKSEEGLTDSSTSRPAEA